MIIAPLQHLVQRPVQTRVQSRDLDERLHHGPLPSTLGTYAHLHTTVQDPCSGTAPGSVQSVAQDPVQK